MCTIPLTTVVRKEMFESINSFIETLIDRPVKIKEYYYKK